MLRGDCPPSVHVSFETGKIVTQKYEIWQLPLRVLRGGMVIGGGPELRGSPCYYIVVLCMA